MKFIIISNSAKLFTVQFTAKTLKFKEEFYYKANIQLINFEGFFTI